MLRKKSRALEQPHHESGASAMERLIAIRSQEFR